MNVGASSFVRFAAWSVRVSGVISVVGIAFLVGMFSAFAAGDRSMGMQLGLVNDTLVLLTYLLTAPTVLVLAALTPIRSQILALVVPSMGLAGIAWVVVWQALLIGGAVTFEQQIGLLAIGYWVLGAWFIVAGHLATRAGLVQRGGWMGLVAATYVGYPVWAIWMGRRLDHVADAGSREASRPAA